MLKKSAVFHWAWIILIICFIDLFINYAIRFGYGVILPEMIRELGFSRTAGGSIYNAYLLTYIALTPLTGYLTDRLGARRVITSCILILGIGVLLMGTVTSLKTACIAYAIAGIGATGLWTPVITVVQRWYSVSRRGLALGILSTGYGLGFATMGLVFPLIVYRFDWRYAWYFLGIASLSMVIMNGFLLRSDPESYGYTPWGEGENEHIEGESSVMSEPAFKNILSVFMHRSFWLIGFSYFCISYSLYGFATFMVDYASSQLGMPLEKASLLATVHGLCQVVGVLTIVPLSDYIGRRKTLLFSNIFITCVLGGILAAGNHSLMLFILVGIIAPFHGATWPTYGACAGDYFPKEFMGTVIGVWTPFYGLGAMMAHWVGGILRDSTGIYDQAFLINTAMAALAALLMYAVKQDQG